ncbi:hypothetical protein AXG93_2351s1030 [Marchantia polymorpha subsp. ruderalis]|uniref:Uncharacterized protein n=1 Tax=Marchantia polymorpha subsp. ruderalis TaxID=1480154 RepID=A0A176W7C0_MARPO|nr:hypothetical protein AXG93_2351s1030 [Marchantia polymorpha subsp. ruderalis]
MLVNSEAELLCGEDDETKLQEERRASESRKKGDNGQSDFGVFYEDLRSHYHLIRLHNDVKFDNAESVQDRGAFFQVQLQVAHRSHVDDDGVAVGQVLTRDPAVSDVLTEHDLLGVGEALSFFKLLVSIGSALVSWAGS